MGQGEKASRFWACARQKGNPSVEMGKLWQSRIGWGGDSVLTFTFMHGGQQGGAVEDKVV